MFKHLKNGKRNALYLSAIAAMAIPGQLGFHSLWVQLCGIAYLALIVFKLDPLLRQD